MITNMKEQQCLQLLQNTYLGHVAYMGQNVPYVLPITYYYDSENNYIISISGEGHKIDCMREQGAVSLSLSNVKGLNDWESVLVQGKFEELNGSDAKHQLHQFVQGIKKIAATENKFDLQFLGDFSSKIPSKESSVVFRITINEITGKQRKPEKKG